MSVKIIATGDIHIGKKSSGISGDSEVLSAKYTWNRIVETAINEKADAVALTGDVVDQDNRFFEAVGPLQAGFHKLNEAGIRVLIVAGNHDYDVLRQVADADKYDNLRILGTNDQWQEITLPLNGQSVRFVGWSFTSRFVHTDPLAKLSVQGSESPTIGLLHAELDTPESSYAPVKSDNLRHHPVDAWILGHIHKPETIRHDNPFIAYPGSPHALNPKEQGVHGPLLITIESKNNIRVETISLSPVRYETLNIDISEAEDEAGFRKLVLGETERFREVIQSDAENLRFLVLDLIISGEHAAPDKVEAWATGIREDYQTGDEFQTSVRKVEFDIRPSVENMEKLATESSPAGLLAQTIVAIENGDSTPFLDSLIRKWKNGVERVNNASTFQELKTHSKILEAEEETARKEILSECKKILGELLNQQPHD
ncbi:MAG: metallophosphoesterase family protein [Marinilabiliaceae bacterium]